MKNTKQIKSEISDLKQEKFDIFAKILSKMDFKELSEYVEEHTDKVLFVVNGKKYEIKIKEII